MKKTFIVALAAFLLFGASVSAMSEEDLEATLTATYTINGATFKASDSNIALVRRYLAENEISEADCDYIAAKFNEAIEIIEKSGVTKLSDLSSTYKNQISALATQVSKNTAVKVTIAGNGNITVYNTDGSKFATVGSAIKNTGAVSTVVVLGAISTVGAIYFANKVRKANN